MKQKVQDGGKNASPIEGTIAGVFVGGAGRRMGGCAKGILQAPEGGTLIERWVETLRRAGVARVILVGRHDGYGALGLEMVDDEPSGIGPLGGLVALLRRAGSSRALALACDMPFVSPALVTRLVSAADAPIVAPRRGALWEPLCARYDASLVLPAALRRVAAGQFSLQPLLTESGALALSLDAAEADRLLDWDTPEDMASRPS
jgi:molybdopterin-guanine dinucleotide biosynthesis protein A